MPARTVPLTPDQQAGKAAFKALVKAFGGQEAAAVETGVRQQKISDMGLGNVDEFPTLDLIDMLEERTVGLTGAPHVTRWLARRRGFALVALPQTAPDRNGLRECVMRMTRELGDIAACTEEALHPSSPEGVEVSTDEAADILREVEHLIEEAAATAAILKRIVAARGVAISPQGDAE